MAETITPKEVMEAAKAEHGRRTGDESWAEKMFSQKAQERGAEEVPQPEAKEAEPQAVMEARLEDGGVAQISPEFAGTENPVKLGFRRAPELGALLYLEKPMETTSKEGGTGFRKFYRAEEPMRGVPKQEGTVYLRAEAVDPEDVESLKAEAQDMREYLTGGTLAQLGIAETEARPEAEEMPVAA